MVETTTCPEVATIYAQFPWLEKVCPQTEVDRAFCFCAPVPLHEHMPVCDVSAYLVLADGGFSEIEQRVIKIPLWSVFVVSHKAIDINQAIQNSLQVSSAAYVVLVQHSDRCVVIFDLENA